MTELEKRLRRELYRRSLYDFVKDFWNTCDSSKLVDGKLIKFYCEVFQYFTRAWTGVEVSDVSPIIKDGKIYANGKWYEGFELIDVRHGKKNLNLNVPPRHMKSKIFNVIAPVWLWTMYPVKAVSVSHTGALAGKMNSDRYNIVNSELFRELYAGKVDLVSDSKSSMATREGGELYSINRDAFTGYGGDIIINDDITNAETARKDKEEMNNAWSYYQNTMPSRINNPDKSFILNIQQRLAPNDITGHILNDKNLREQYEFVVLSAICRKNTVLVCPISGELIVYEKGEGLWKERFGDYSGLRFQVGESVFETQYRQNPIASDKTLIKQDRITIKQATEVPSIDDSDQIYASHDFPVKDKASNDFLGSVLAYRVGGVLYFIDSLEKHMAFVQSVSYVQQLDTLYPSCIQVIEDKANGAPVIEQLQDVVAGIQSFNPGTASKAQRLESASLYRQSKNVVFVATEYDEKSKKYVLGKGLENLVNRLLNFPFVEHDDIVDAFDMLVLFVFMDKRYSVYFRSFDENNIIDKKNADCAYHEIFFNKEGDLWKVSRIGVKYGIKNTIYVLDEQRFKASAKDGLAKLKELYPSESVAIDCSRNDSMSGIYMEGLSVVRSTIEDFDKSVVELNLAFANKQVLVCSNCLGTKSDIETFKYAKTKDETMKYRTEHDGYIANIRNAMKYFK